MSEYRVIESKIFDPQAIVAGLLSLGIPKSCIEVHKTPQALYGYHGDKRSETGEIIVRQETVNRYLSGSASNDLGFKKVNGTYRAIVSGYDEGRWWNSKKDMFHQESAAVQAERTASNLGYEVTSTRENGQIILKCKKRF